LFGKKTTEPRDTYYQGNSNQQYYDNRSQNLRQFNEAYEPLNPEQRLRKSGVPIGLKNVGNSTILLSDNGLNIVKYSLLCEFIVSDVLHESKIRFCYFEL